MAHFPAELVVFMLYNKTLFTVTLLLFLHSFTLKSCHMETLFVVLYYIPTNSYINCCIFHPTRQQVD